MAAGQIPYKAVWSSSLLRGPRKSRAADSPERTRLDLLAQLRPIRGISAPSRPGTLTLIESVPG